jgi:hypothetical protein
MKKAMAGAALAMALATACGDLGVRAGEADVDVGDGTPVIGNTTEDTGSSAQALAVDLRMRATGIDRYASLMVLPRAVRVTVDGVPADVELVDAPVELARADAATRFAGFALAPEAREVEFVVELAPAGVFEAMDGLGWLDSRATVLRFKASADNLREKGKAVLVLDADRAFVPQGIHTLALVPNFRVRF